MTKSDKSKCNYNLKRWNHQLLGKFASLVAVCSHIVSEINYPLWRWWYLWPEGADIGAFSLVRMIDTGLWLVERIKGRSLTLGWQLWFLKQHIEHSENTLQLQTQWPLRNNYLRFYSTFNQHSCDFNKCKYPWQM